MPLLTAKSQESRRPAVQHSSSTSPRCKRLSIRAAIPFPSSQETRNDPSTSARQATRSRRHVAVQQPYREIQVRAAAQPGTEYLPHSTNAIPAERNSRSVRKNRPVDPERPALHLSDTWVRNVNEHIAIAAVGAPSPPRRVRHRNGHCSPHRSLQVFRIWTVAETWGRPLLPASHLRGYVGGAAWASSFCIGPEHGEDMR